jgi:iron complex transport system substrate-binding protein
LIYNQEFRALIESNKIIDVGNDQSLNYEKLIEVQPDIIFFYDFGPSTAAVVQRLEDLGLKVIRVAEFMEESPLGKAEWIKFFGAVYNKMNLADSIFNVIESSYLELISLDENSISKPMVFTGLPWKGEWYQPGGASFQAKYFEDAGADYIWSENTSTSGITVDREVIYEKAIQADFWLHPSNALTMTEITNDDERFAHFESFKQGRVYNNNARLNENMGNDYWESGLLNPHLILKDLMFIFHPELYPDHQLHYYRKLE